MKLYVGNLPFDATEGEVRQMFEPYGPLDSVSLVTDGMTGRFRGFGFVEMNGDGAGNAIAGLNGKDLRGRALTVNEARPKTGGGGRGGRDSGGRGGRDGGRGGRDGGRGGRW